MNHHGKPRGDLRYVAPCLPLGFYRNSFIADGRNRIDGRQGIRRVPRPSRDYRLTTFVVNMLASIGIAAGTDYGIFFVGRYQEARQAGEDRETAFYTTYRGVAKVVLASGSTIAGALFCLSFTRLPSFQAMGVPCAVGIFVAVAVALTLVPAVIAVGSRVGLFDPRRMIRVRGWRRVGTAIVRWPAPILAATLAVALIGLLTLPIINPATTTSSSSPKYSRQSGLRSCRSTFSQSRMMAPELLLVEADHDLRNPADFLILNKLAKAVLAVPGISSVQSITRPTGAPIRTLLYHLCSACKTPACYKIWGFRKTG